MTGIEAGYVSADGHVVEPADLWTTRIDKQFRDKAPRVESRPNGDYYLIDGFEPIPVGLEGVAIDDKIAGKIKSAQGYRHAATRPERGIPRPVWPTRTSITFAPKSFTPASACSSRRPPIRLTFAHVTKPTTSG